MFKAQFRLRTARGSQACVQGQLIEQVVKDRHARLGITLFFPVLIAALHNPKMCAQDSAVGQAHQRTVDTQNPMPAPAGDKRAMLGAINCSQDCTLIKFNEGAGQELRAGMGECSGTGQGRSVRASQFPEKLVQASLERFETFLEEKHHEPGKR